MVDSVCYPREAALGHTTRKSRLGVYVALFIGAACLAGAAANYITKKPPQILNGLNHYSIIIDLRSGGYRLRPVLANTDKSEHFEDVMARVKPFAAITGTFFDPHYKPLGDIVIDGKLANRGGQRQGVGITHSGKIVFRERRGSARIDWSGCREGIACGPRLLRAGKIAIDVRADGFKQGAATLKAARCAAGATGDGKLIMLAVRDPITLQTLAEAMSQLGAVDAINLDGGSLCGFYSNGKCRIRPLMPVSNVLVVHKNKKGEVF